MKFRKKPVVIDAITFDELVQYGRENGGNIVNGMPWSFTYKGHHISHERDDCYLIPTLEGTHNFTKEDMLITGVKGEIYPCKKDIFEATYEPAEYESENPLFRGEPPRFDPVEQEIQAKGLNAPRITPADIEANIVDVEIVKHVSKSGQVLRFAVLTTRNGFAVVGKPSCAVSSANDNAEIGEKVAIDNSKEELWPLMGYELRSNLAWRDGQMTGEQESGAA